MFYKILLLFLLIFYVLNFHAIVEAKIDMQEKLASDEIVVCDYTELESKMMVLKTDNEFFKQRFEIIQYQLNNLENILQSFKEKIDKIPQNLQSAEKKILSRSKEHYDELYYVLQTRFQEPAADEKLRMMIDIKGILEGQDVLLESFSERMQNVEHELKNTTLKTRQLSASVSKNLTILDNIESTLTDIKSATATKSDQRELKQFIQTHFNRSELFCATPPYPTSCADFNANYCKNNKCRIFNQIYGPKPFYVSCDSQTDGGGWTVIQRRINGAVDFYRNWSEYKAGFGDIEGEFFIGLDKLHALTTALQPMELLIQLKDFNNTLTYVKYDEFIVEDELENYKLLKVGKCTGNAKYDTFSPHQGYMFSTKDRDNDVDSRHCAEYYKGGWWYYNCLRSNLNGKYYGTEKVANTTDGICWNTLEGCTYFLKFVQMMIRPKKI